MMTFGLVSMNSPSLAALTEAVKAKMSRVSLHLRFTEAAVEFMKKCAAFAFKQKCHDAGSIDTRFLNHFKKIHIVDSTSWDINPLLKDVFPGSGGGASVANCKVQFGYEYLSGNLSFYEITHGTAPDNGYSSSLPGKTKKNELLIADLGYFRIDTFGQISKKGAFFLSRHHVASKVRNVSSGKLIDLHTILEKATGDAYELPVLVGLTKENQVACRLICLRVSEEIANTRRRNHLKNAEKKGRTPSKEFLFMAGWTLMITNIPAEWLPAGMVRHLYRLRWQIELLFKQLKTTLKINSTNTAKEPRFRCELLGKLIVAILIQRVHSVSNIGLWNKNKQEVSFDKLYKRLQERAFIIVLLLIEGINKAEDYFKNEINRLVKNCKKEKQNSRRSTLDFLQFGLSQDVENYPLT